MKRYYIAAAIIAAANLAVYPMMNSLAVMERGYDAIGGEEMLLIFGFFIAFCVIDHGLTKARRARIRKEVELEAGGTGQHLFPCNHRAGRSGGSPE
jgi:hypothetical protein